VKFFANPNSGTATASVVRQTFSQVPTPGSVALVALGGLVAARRRRAN